MPELDLVTALIIAAGFVLGGLAAGAVVSAASWLPAYFAFAVPMLAPLIFRFLIEPGELPLVMGAVLILFVVFLGSLARTFNASLKQTLSLRVERSRLLDQRDFNKVLGAVPDNTFWCYEGRHEKEPVKQRETGSPD